MTLMSMSLGTSEHFRARWDQSLCLRAAETGSLRAAEMACREEAWPDCRSTTGPAVVEPLGSAAGRARNRLTVGTYAKPGRGN